MTTIEVRPDLSIPDHVVNVDGFIGQALAVDVVAAVKEHARWRDYGPVSTKAAGTVKAWKAGCNPAAAWWGLEWAFLDGENHLVRTHDSADLPDALRRLLGLVEARWPITCDMIQVNHYRDGEGLIWHSDLDSRGWTVNRTVTVAIGAPRDVLYAHFPADWKERRIVGARPDEAGVEPEHVVRSLHGSATMQDIEGMRSLLHAVRPGPGERYGITFRQHRMW